MNWDLDPEMRDYEGEIRRMHRRPRIRRFLMLTGGILSSIAGIIVALLFFIFIF